MRKAALWLLVMIVIVVVFVPGEAKALPENVTTSDITLGNAETGGLGGAATVNAQGGNITELNISANTQTGFWQGLWGQIKQTFSLKDATGNIFYNWSMADVTTGEIYFTNTTSITWGSNIRNASDDDVGKAQLQYNWSNSSSIDNLTNTYNRATAHNEFNITDLVQINDSTTPAVQLEGGLFNNTMLWDDTWDQPLWVALINPDAASFNGATADFEALLPIQGERATNVFYLYAELE